MSSQNGMEPMFHVNLQRRRRRKRINYQKEFGHAFIQYISFFFSANELNNVSRYVFGYVYKIE